MGFQRAATVTVAFPPEHELHGFEAVCKRISTGYYLDKPKATERPYLQEALEELTSALVSWNYEDEKGKAVPATAAGLRRLDIAATKALYKAWLDEVAEVKAPLSPSSPRGGPPSIDPGSIPMTPL
ncbi:hypothetical protein [Herbidospora daliensis]|uniref:hypothetical protein n=1 Tax=Herbidospora daliensis TaxID=295585 RepID=UPI000ADC4FA7|nr:hypothetical protein [Herbidospora daliensis]